ncbi:hypothetical protein NQZ68_034891 [Dissostichus eleginoides]|nr:hypothetical protein NQZ68_034891 [Dissostichus eleginoides]
MTPLPSPDTTLLQAFGVLFSVNPTFWSSFSPAQHSPLVPGNGEGTAVKIRTEAEQQVLMGANKKPER